MKVIEHNHHITLQSDHVTEITDTDIRWADNGGWESDEGTELDFDSDLDSLLDTLDSVPDLQEF